MKIEIKSRWSGEVLYSFECENNTVKLTLEAAVRSRANLDGANLYQANLVGANLYQANLVGVRLDGANLYQANLVGANLEWAQLRNANLDGASLVGANIYRANFDGANLHQAKLHQAKLDGAHLVGGRPVFTIGPIGSRCAYLTAYLTDSGVKLRAGCFFGTLAEFETAVVQTHGEGKHGEEYSAAIALVNKHAEIWGKNMKEGK